jgi:tetratricopeptide (TPR) repeat protein
MVSASTCLIALVLMSRGSPSQVGGESPAQAAQRALEEKDYPRAEQFYRELVRSNPSCAECLTNLAIALHFQGKSTEAIQALESALRIKELPGTLALLGANYCRIHEYDRARPVLERAKAYFSDSRVLVALGPCYLEAGDPIDAITVYQELVRRNEAPVDENAVGLAKAYFHASQEYMGRLQTLPGSAEYLSAIWTARKNASPDARGAFPAAFKNSPYLRAGMSPAELARLLPQHSQDPALLYVLGVLCAEQAMKVVVFCQQHYPDSAYVRRLHAEMLASQGQEEAALEVYKGLGATPPVPIGLYYDIAVLYRKRRDWEKALQYFELDRGSAPDNERALIGISECLLRMGRYEALRKLLLPLASSGSHPQWALLDLSSAETELGRPQVAIRWLKLAARQDPKDGEVHYRLMQLYSRTGQADLARQEKEIFLRLGKGSGAHR